MDKINLILIGILSLLLISSCHEIEEPGEVSIYPGDDWQVANDENPPGTVFILQPGVHKQQRVHNPRPSTMWIGKEGAIMDGENQVSAAFSGKAYGVVIQGFTIRNYFDNGILFKAGQKILIDSMKITDSGSGTGEKNAGIRLDNVEQFTVTNNHIERVTAGLLTTSCEGPINISWNTGINTGRNFIQLNHCRGEGIRIEYNSMERRGNYLHRLAEDVVDWINIYKSEGTYHDPIQVNYNRARGHGFSETGSFIMLGDGGGRFQVAHGNVGVTPGQVGIGIAGGEFITVDGNKLYSEEWQKSNVALYSAKYSDGACSNHTIRNNQSYWRFQGKQNNVWTDRRCSPVFENNQYPDQNLNQDIWYKARAASGNPHR